jgi:aminoglycoside phosphotransferase (APT) family kinase protein
VAGRRDLDATRQALAAWFGAQVGAPATVSDLSIPKAGFSNETVLGRLSAAGEQLDFVVRIQPTGHQLFVEPDALFQAAMMKALRRAGGPPVPTVLFEESDPSVLGAPFFVMQRVFGRVPSDRPGWHAGGWTTELDPAECARLYDNGLRALVALHAVDCHDGFECLTRSGRGDAFDRYLEHVTTWYEWSKPSLRFSPEVVTAALEYVRSRRPEGADEVCISWGDARVGNMIFDDALEVAAVLDWEGAALGPPGIDAGWWLMFEAFFTVEEGTPRLAGVPGPEETLARYEALSGRKIHDIRYYQILAGLVFSLINSRLADLYLTRYKADPEQATVFIDRTTRMTAAWLADA